MDVLVTGLPRSGLTTVAALIDHLPNAVCLNRPPGHARMAAKASSLAFCKWLIGDFLWTRQQLMRQLPVKDFRATDGAPLLDSVKDARRPLSEEGKRLLISFTRGDLREGFLLGAKHHALYTTLLPRLITFHHFRIVAVIRNPLDTLLSWQQMGGGLAQGKLPYARRFWPDAGRIGASSANALTRMAQLYDLHLQRYHDLRGHVQIVKYEDAVADPMMVSALFGGNQRSEAAQWIERRTRMIASAQADPIREALRQYGVFTKLYYPNS